jgi:hypothetical protein
MGVKASEGGVGGEKDTNKKRVEFHLKGVSTGGYVLTTFEV